MTEQEWLMTTDAEMMIGLVCGDGRPGELYRSYEHAFFYDRKRYPPVPASDRKLYLLACACAQRHWDLFTSEHSRKVVAVVERYAEGKADRTELEAAATEAMEVHLRAYQGSQLDRFLFHSDFNSLDIAGQIATPNAKDAVLRALAFPIALCFDPKNMQISERAWNNERLAQIALLRDIFGNPFRPVAVDPAWLTPDVTALAQAIYDERRFADLPILADALEEAGCTNDDMLNHCRGDGDHARGCWVVDLLLVKV